MSQNDDPELIFPKEVPHPSSPLPPELDTQLSRLSGLKEMQGPFRMDALRWLLHFHLLGNQDRQNNPDLSREQIYVEFYTYARKYLGFKFPRPYQDQTVEENLYVRGKALFARLTVALGSCYENGGPCVNDSIVIKIARGRSRKHEPSWSPNHAPPPQMPRLASDPDVEHGPPTLFQKLVDPPSSNAQAIVDAGADVISDEDMVGTIEANLLASVQNVVVISPDLSNIGDETSSFSQLLRTVVHDNAAKGVNYLYIFPKEEAGPARIQRLRHCFHQTSGKLILCMARQAYLLALTPLRTHYTVFMDGRRSSVYMQLPILDSKKGWIKLPRANTYHFIRSLEKILHKLEQHNSHERPLWKIANQLFECLPR